MALEADTELLDEIRDALGKLDPKVDEHWTEQGLPKLEVVHQFTGNSAIQRQQVTEAAPAFTRENPDIPVPENAVDVAPVATPESIEADRAKLADIRAAIVDKEVERDALTRDIEKLNHEADDLLRRLEKAAQEPPIVGIKAFLAAQQQQRADRVEEQNALTAFAREMQTRRGAPRGGKAKAS